MHNAVNTRRSSVGIKNQEEKNRSQKRMANLCVVDFFLLVVFSIYTFALSSFVFALGFCLYLAIFAHCVASLSVCFNFVGFFFLFNSFACRRDYDWRRGF